MPTWIIHDRWARKLGISKEVSKYVNNLIDAIEEGKLLPQEYLDFVDKESKKEANSKKKVVSVSLKERTLSHDSGRRKDIRWLSAKIQLRFLRQKGEDYINAWYLHQALDYLDQDIREFMKNTFTSIESAFEIYKKNKPQIYSEKIINFLKGNIQELKIDLNL